MAQDGWDSEAFAGCIAGMGCCVVSLFATITLAFAFVKFVKWAWTV